MLTEGLWRLDLRRRAPPGLLIHRGDADLSCEKEPRISRAQGSKEASESLELVSLAAATSYAIAVLARVLGRAASLESLLD